MNYLQLVGIAIGVLSALVGFSIKFYLLIDTRLRIADNAFYRLLRDKSLNDASLVSALLGIVGGRTKEIDTPELSQYGSLKRAGETVRLEFFPGRVEQGPNYYGINPIHGFNRNGGLTLQADKYTFYDAYRSAFFARQQSSAFLFLMVAFVIQLVSLLLSGT